MGDENVSMCRQLKTSIAMHDGDMLRHIHSLMRLFLVIDYHKAPNRRQVTIANLTFGRRHAQGNKEMRMCFSIFLDCSL